MNFGPSKAHFDAMHGELRAEARREIIRESGGYFEVVRSSHPYQPGDTINGRLVVETFFRCTAGNICGDAYVVFEDGEEVLAEEIAK